MRFNLESALLKNSLKMLLLWLHRYHQEKAYVLIDEYDAPIHAAYLLGYYDSMIEFMRGWLTEGLKDSPHLEKGILTGILRIGKESIFSGFNNPACYTVLEDRFSDKFGLLEQEVGSLLKEYQIAGQADEVKNWYNGYKIGSSFLYNPWSILQYVQSGGVLKPYWINTSDNALIHRLLIQASPAFKEEMEKLLQKKSVTKSIQEGMNFKELERQSGALWGLFLFSGYLTLTQVPVFEEGGLRCDLMIPNKEVESLYRSIFQQWLCIDQTLPPVLESLIRGEVERFSDSLQELIIQTMSYYDIPLQEPEKVYHAFVLGLLVLLDKTYEITSNRESGYGRYDVCLIPKDPSALGIVLEFKKVKENGLLEEAALEALDQMQKRRYAQELTARGIKKILLLGCAFQGKKVFVKGSWNQEIGSFIRGK